VLSVYQVKKAEPDPPASVEKYIFTPANNVIDVSGRGFASINLHRTSFETPFLNYRDVTSSFNSSDVLSTRFSRSVGTPPDNIDYLQFQTTVNNTNEEISVKYAFELSHEYTMTDKTKLVVYTFTNFNETELTLIGEDLEGNEDSFTLSLDEAYQKYFLYIIPIRTLTKVNHVKLTYICQPEGHVKINTVFRILNLFDGAPTVDFQRLEQGALWLKIDDVEFPHRFVWKQLMAKNMTTLIKLNLEPKSISTVNTITYLWDIPNLTNATIYDANVIFVFSRSIEAPLSQAEISVEENGVPHVINVMENITQAFSDQSPNPRVVLSIPEYGKNCQISITYLYWHPFWTSIAFLSLAIIMVESIVILIYRRSK
jgi:hypothetical protein